MKLLGHCTAVLYTTLKLDAFTAVIYGFGQFQYQQHKPAMQHITKFKSKLLFFFQQIQVKFVLNYDIQPMESHI